MKITYWQILSQVNRQSPGGDHFSQKYLFTIWKYSLCIRSKKSVDLKKIQTTMCDMWRLRIFSVFVRYKRQWRQVWVIYSTVPAKYCAFDYYNYMTAVRLDGCPECSAKSLPHITLETSCIPGLPSFEKEQPLIFTLVALCGTSITKVPF